MKRFSPINYFAGTNVRSISFEDQLFICLMKLKANQPYLHYSVLFNVSRETIRNIFLTFLHLIHETVYTSIVCNQGVPSQRKNLINMHKSFEDGFSNSRMIIDCTEVQTEIPRCDMDAQRQTYSNYKSRNTLKFLVGTSPNGAITFVSKAYPGSTSDFAVTEHCGVLHYMCAGDLILADKGFDIFKLMPEGVSLNLPPFLYAKNDGSKQFSKQEAAYTRKVARSRVHVERAIQRIRLFDIVNFFPHHLRPYANEIFACCSTLANFQTPILSWGTLPM